MDPGGTGNLLQDEKLAHFQSLTGVEDITLCTQILEAHNWDLDSAVSSMVDDNVAAPHNSQPEAPPPRYTSRIPRAAGPGSALGLAQLTQDGNDQQLLPPPLNNTGENNNNNPGLVWRIVTLPFNVVRGGLVVVSGAMGLGVWLAGSLLSYSLGAIGLGEQNRARLAEARDRLLPVATAGSVQAAQFIRGFELEFGEHHPNFQPLSFMEALRRSSEEFKFLFVYLHSPEHVDTPPFCQGTLCSESVREFLNQNFVIWGADVRFTEGFQMFNSLKASTFPFCAVVMASSNQRIALLQQIDGFKSPEALITLLQKVVEDQGATLVALRVEEEERRLNRQLREEQDAAYQAALRADQERERKRLEEAERLAKEAEEQERQRREKELEAEKAAKEAAERQAALQKRRMEKAMALGEEPGKGPDVTQVLVRFPNGERRERRFFKTSKVQSVYDYVDSLGCLDASEYSLVSNFPRTVYSSEKLEQSLTEAGLHPHASLFVQVESP